MKLILTFFSVSFLMFVHAQSAADDIDTAEVNRFFREGWVSGNPCLSLEAGFNYYTIGDLNNELTKLYGEGFGPKMLTFGFSATETMLMGRKWSYDQHFEYHYLSSSQPTFVQQADTLRYFLSGFYFGLDWSKDLLPKRTKLDFLVGAGFNTGRLAFQRRQQMISEDFYKATNPFFAPKLSVEARAFVFKGLSLSVRGDLQYDITKPKWNYKHISLDPLPDTKVHGYSVHVTLGWGGRYTYQR